VFGSSGLSLTGCNFGECVRQGVIDTTSGASSNTSGGDGNSLSGGVIGGLAAVGALIGLALFGLLLGWWSRRKQRRLGAAYIGGGKHGGFAVEWSDVSYVVPQSRGSGSWSPLGGTKAVGNDKVILDGISGRVEPGQLLGILGPSGAHVSSLCEVSVPNNAF
jgi:ABC-type multidrug transport system fused ATPase/permease subunit